MRRPLTAALADRSAPPASGRVEITDTLMPGLVLRIGANGYRSYLVRGRIHGRAEPPIRVTLGDARFLSLAEAREKARELLRAMYEGKDPRAEIRAQAASVEVSRRTLFAAVAQRYIDEYVLELRSGRQTEPLIRQHLIREWGSRQIADISQDDIAHLIGRIAKAGHAATARRVLAICKTLFKWAASPGRPREERLASNPALNLQARDFSIRPGRRQVALSADHLRAIWICAGELGPQWCAFLRLLMLSGQRRSEIAGLQWSEINFDERVIVLPPERMKSKRAHEIPMSPAMYEILAGIERTAGPRVFTLNMSNGSVNRMKARLDALIEQHTPGLPSWVLHDIRRAVRTGLGAIPSIPHDIRELVIAHVPPALTQTYDLHGYRDEKRQALTLWSERLARIVEPPAGNVTPLRVAR